MNRPTVASVFRPGGDYVWEDVVCLRNACDDNIVGGCRFICMTNIVNRIEERDGVVLVPFKKDFPGWWGKIELFGPRALKFRPFLYFDLDVAIVGDITKWATLDEDYGFTMVVDYHHKRPGSTPMFIPKKHDGITNVWKEFIQKPMHWMNRFKRGGDQEYIAEICMPDQYWQDLFPGQITNFKQTREQEGWLRELPEDLRIVGFHGKPRPRETPREFEWVANYIDKYHPFGNGGVESIVENRTAPIKTRTASDIERNMYDEKHSGTLLVLGSAEGGLDELRTIQEHRASTKIMTIGHAASLVKADFCVSDHYETINTVRRLQKEHHLNFSTHCTRCAGWWKYPDVDYWWDWERSDATSAQTAIRIGLCMGFDEIILCGCPLQAGNIQHPEQVKKDGKDWPPKGDFNSGEDQLTSFKRNFAKYCGLWHNKVFSMSGFTRDCLGAPSLEYVVPEKKEEPPDLITIMCPSRERPDRLSDMLDSLERTTTRDIEILVSVDSDDPCLSDYMKLKDRISKLFVCKKGKCVGEQWNIMAKEANGDLLMMANDDLIWHTNDWDTIIRNRVHDAYKDGIYVAWADDGTGKAHERCAFPIVSRRWYETLGYFTPECFNHLWCDTWVTDIGRRLRRLCYIPEVLVEHCHFNFKKADFDKTYQRHRVGAEAKKKRADDKEMYRVTAPQRSKDAEKLQRLKGK